LISTIALSAADRDQTLYDVIPNRRMSKWVRFWGQNVKNRSGEFCPERSL